MKCPLCESRDTLTFFQWEDAVVYQQAFLPSRTEAHRSPRGDIRLVHCGNCSFIWNALFKPELLKYTPSYEASQMYSPTFRKYANGVARRLVRRYGLRQKKIIEIGCGDGAFLKLLCSLGNNRGVGFDPASKILRDPTTRTVFRPDEYSRRSGHQLRGDFICCRHVLEHIRNPGEFLREIRMGADRSGKLVLFFEVPNVMFSLRRMAFWDIYYEHCSYFSRRSLSFLFSLCGLRVLDTGEGFGTQYVWIEAAAKSGHKVSAGHRPAGKIRDTDRAVVRFASSVPARIKKMRRELAEAARRKRVVLWGAGAKAVTLLNILNIEGDRIEHVVDINPRKQGKYIPGTGQKVIAPEDLLRNVPDKILVLNPGYLQEVRKTLKNLKISADLQTLD